MGLSVLIPVYQHNAGPLVLQLHKQLEVLGIAFEILVFDDSAQTQAYTWAATLSDLPHFSLLTQTENLGRSKARNYLWSKARFAQLLFLDGDMLLSPDFVGQFWTHIQQFPAAVWVGKIDYPAEIQSLRATIGRKKECIDAEIRNRNPYNGFSAAVCALPRDLSVRFPENLQGYGHEDSWFGLMLKEAAIEVKHCDVAAFHIDNDNETTFLHKTAEAAKNLAVLYHREPLFQKQYAAFMLLRFYQKIPCKPAWLWLASLFPFRFMKWVIKRTHSVLLYDFLKFFYFLSALKQLKAGHI
jgi:glycosyltransferase involved in cell wall biosynthesis